MFFALANHGRAALFEQNEPPNPQPQQLNVLSLPISAPPDLLPEVLGDIPSRLACHGGDRGGRDRISSDDEAIDG